MISKRNRKKKTTTNKRAAFFFFSLLPKFPPRLVLILQIIIHAGHVLLQLGLAELQRLLGRDGVLLVVHHGVLFEAGEELFGGDFALTTGGGEVAWEALDRL